jgi:Big-like domain-containing protein
MRRLSRLLFAAILVAACARMAPPPGGPARHTPPVLLGTFPDSGVAPCDFNSDAEFRFDEITSDAGDPNFGYGNGALEKLILFSPDTLVPTVDWRRSRIAVRPRHGWQPHTTYRIELLAGVIDLHQNRTKTGSLLTFTVCGPKATHVLSGRAIDWVAVRAVPGALIEAFHLPDSLGYRTVADSTGRFRLEGLPDGPYLVVATIDQDHNNRRGRSEAWDSVRVAASTDTVGEIWTFPRDTAAPKIQDVTRADSFTIAVTFTRPVDPSLRLDSTSIRVGVLPDTASIGPVEAMPKALYDSTHKPPPAPKKLGLDSVKRAELDSAKRADSVAHADTSAPVVNKAGELTIKKLADSLKKPVTIAADSVTGPPPDLPAQKRPVIGNVIIIRTQGQVRLGSKYYVELRNVRLVGGQTGPPVGRSFETQKAPTAADSAKARADSLKPKTHADSLKAKAAADSLKKTKPDSGKVIKPW